MALDLIVGAISQNYVALIANAGALAILAWAVSFHARRTLLPDRRPSFAYSLRIGALFGFTAAVLMYLPVEVQPGVIADARGGPIILSGVIGGPVGAFLASAIGVATRLHVGGAGALAGATALPVYGVMGAAYGWWLRGQGRNLPGLPALGGLTLFATVATIPTVLLIPVEDVWALAVRLWPVILVANLAAVAILGSLLHRESERMQHEAELSRQRELARQGMEAKSRFLAAMSHEIRTPLNSVLGILQIIDRSDLPAELRLQLKTARESGFFLLSLVNQVLDYSRIEAGAAAVTEERFSLEALMSGLHSTFKPMSDEKGLALVCEVVGDSPDFLVGDYGHIRQILFNLIGNAIKFTERGEIRVSATPHPGHDRQCRVLFAVSDTGPGIASDDTARIFERFSQTETGARYGGAGLGLSIAAELAKAMRGDLRVHSRVGAGSTFELDLPLRVSEIQIEEAAATGSYPGRPLRLLLVEDNEVNQMVARSMLERDGHEVDVLGNGLDAVQAVERDPSLYDLILMDVQMPGMGGVEAAARIRAIEPDARKLPIVALTANAFDQQREEYLRHGMQDTVTKPIRLDDLRAKLTRHARPPELAARRSKAFARMAPAALQGEGESQQLDLPILHQVFKALPGESLDDFLQTVSSESDHLLAELRIANGNGDETTRITHQLRGMLGNAGLKSASTIALQIEQSGRPGRDQKDEVDRLAGAIQESLEEIARIRAPKARQ